MKLYFFLTFFIACSFTLKAQGVPGGNAADSMGYFCEACHNDCDTMVFTHPGTCPYCGMKLVYQSIAERKKMMDNYMKQLTICFYLQDGVEVLDFAGPMEAFSAAGFKVFTVSKKKEPIRSQGILTITPDYSIDNAPPADILAFFGGSTAASVADPALISWIRSREQGTQYFFSVCTGAFIMGKAGILDGLTATTFHSRIGELQAALPSTKVLANTRFVDNGRVITTAGVSAGIDGALHLVAKLKGEEVARTAAEYMEYDKWIPGQGLVLKDGNAAR